MSIIVPLHRPTPAFRRCIDVLLALPGDRHEILVVSDEPAEGLPDAVRNIVTGSPTDTSPAEKRDAALAEVSGEICAFIDDDAYPAGDWVDKALARFEDPGVDAVGGPGITPPGSPLRERAGGAFYESRFGSGSLRHRFVAEGPVRDTDDWPAYNFFVRTGALREVGGWASKLLRRRGHEGVPHARRERPPDRLRPRGRRLPPPPADPRAAPAPARQRRPPPRVLRAGVPGDLRPARVLRCRRPRSSAGPRRSPCPSGARPFGSCSPARQPPCTASSPRPRCATATTGRSPRCSPASSSPRTPYYGLQFIRGMTTAEIEAM